MAVPDPRLGPMIDDLAAAGANLTLVLPGMAPIRVGGEPERASVVFHSSRAFEALVRREDLALAEAYLAREIDVSGDFLQAIKVTDLLSMGPSWLDRLVFAARLHGFRRRRWSRASIAFHYDRPAEFFLPWLDRWRSYSHGFHRAPDEPLTDAQGRKLQFAIDALGVGPGARVLDVGSGWGCFVEYAGLRGISVHAVTISRSQCQFVEKLIQEKNLPCSVELVDLFDYRPRVRFDGAVLMGALEHLPDYARVARFLARHLKPEARLYADFLAARGERLFGAFLREYIWPGSATYVDLASLLRALMRDGFNVHELADDTASYALTVRDWANGFEATRKELAERFGEATARAFLLYLRSSQFFFQSNRTQAYHLVAGRSPRAPRDEMTAASRASRA